ERGQRGVGFRCVGGGRHRKVWHGAPDRPLGRQELVQGEGPGIPVSGKLLGVSMVSATDGWAVGVNPFKGNHILLHGNGTSWAPVPGPNGGKGALLGVTADSAADAWTAGPRSLVRGGPAPAWHWDGTGWAQVPTPDLGLGPFLFGVSDASPGNAWAVGL